MRKSQNLGAGLSPAISGQIESDERCSKRFPCVSTGHHIEIHQIVEGRVSVNTADAVNGQLLNFYFSRRKNVIFVFPSLIRCVGFRGFCVLFL